MSLTYYLTIFIVLAMEDLADVTEETQNLIENSPVLSISEHTAVKFSGYNIQIPFTYNTNFQSI